MTEELTSTQVILAVGSVMAGVVGLLWRLFLKSVNDNEQKRKELEAKNENHNETILRLTEKVAEFRGEMDGVKGLASSVLERLEDSKKVLEVVEKVDIKTSSVLKHIGEMKNKN